MAATSAARPASSRALGTADAAATPASAADQTSAAAPDSTRSSAPAILGRDEELAVLTGALELARHGQGSALVMPAECGMGKTTMLEAIRPGEDVQLLGSAGIESEAGIPLAGLHRLLQPLAGQIAALPGRHAEILAPIVTEGAGYGGAALALYAAVHRLIIDTAAKGPLLCRIDDVHLMDPITIEALAFAARRVSTEPVLVVFSCCQLTADDVLDGLRQVPLGPLDAAASRQLLADHVPQGLPDDLAEDLIELASGNPRALTELAAALTPEQLAGDGTAPECLPPGSRLRSVLHRRFLRLPADARLLVVMAAVDERLDTDTLVRATADAGIDLGALELARSSGLVRLDGNRVGVPNPLVRSVLRAEAPLVERQAAHRMLAGALDPDQHRLRWTLHRVATAGQPRQCLADELADAASAARETGDFAASSSAYQQAAAMTAPPDVRAQRLIAAATDHSLAGRTRHARAALRQARPLATTSELRGLADLLHGEIELRGGLPALANETLLNAAAELAGADRTLAVTALMLAGEASCLAGNYQQYLAVARRAAKLRAEGAARGAGDPPAIQLMFDHFTGMAATYAGRHAEAVAPLRSVIELARATDHAMSKVWASDAAYTLGDAVVSQELATRAVSLARDQGLAVVLPCALMYLSMAALLHDRHITAVSSSLEGMRVAGAIGQQNAVVDHLTILALGAALLGDRETALLRLDAATGEARRRGLGRPSALSSWAAACADLADDRPADAMNRLRCMAAGTGYLHPAIRVLAAPHFVEAAVRCGEPAKAAHALEVFDQWASATGSTPRLAQSHRCHALLAGGGAGADEHFREAIRLHRAGNTALELAKTELFYAHQLRRSRKPMAAREHLRDALKIFEQYDAEPWARRTRAELRAAGEAVAPTVSRTAAKLTPQQEQIARLVAEGATNREIAAQLVVSPRTVDHHLRNILAKLGVRSRVELTALFR